MIVITNVLHQDDFVAFIKAQKEFWDIIEMPALGYWDGDLVNGESYWPERWSREALLALKQEIGGPIFETMYQGNPVVFDEAEGPYKNEWFQDYTEMDMLKKIGP